MTRNTVFTGRIAVAALALALAVPAVVFLAGFPSAAQAQQVVQPRAGQAGEWRLIGQTHADHAASRNSRAVSGASRESPSSVILHLSRFSA